LVTGDAASHEWRLDIFQHGQPGKEGEALKDDANVDLGMQDRLPVPENLAAEGLR